MIFCSILSNSYSQNRSEKKYVSDSILVQVVESNGYKSIDSIVYKQDTLLRYYLTAKNEYDSMPVYRVRSASMYYTVESENALVYFHKIMLSQDSVYVHGYSEIIDPKKPVIDKTIRNERVFEYNQDKHSDFIVLTNPLMPSSNTEGRINKGLRIGTWIWGKYYFAKTKEHYNAGIRDGNYTVYTKQDSILYQTNFDKGTGVEQIYRDSLYNYSLYHIKYFKDGKQDYEYPLKEFYSRGTIARFVDYKNGIEEEYYLNEKPFIRTEGVFELNEDKEMVQKKGKKFYFDREGNLVYITIFNEKESTSIYYDKKGKTKMIRSGNMIQYFEKGKLKSTLIERKEVKIK